MQLRRLSLDLVRIAPGLAAVGLLLAAPAAAQDEDEEPAEPEEAEEGEGTEELYGRPGAYMLLQFTNNIGTFSSPEPLVATSSGSYSTGVGGAFGYRINEHLAAELAGDWVTGWNVLVAGSSKDLMGGTYGVNVKGYLGGGRFQPYGLFGLGATFMEVQDTSLPVLSEAQWDMGIRIALGADWYVNDEVGLNFAPTLVIPVGINSEVADLLYVSIAIGGFLRFGGE